MNKKTIFLIVIAIIIIVAGLFTYWFFVLNTSDSSDSKQTQNTESQASKPASTKDMYELIADNNKLSTFNDILKSTGLDQTLQTAGPYTVFAPSNEAFNNLTSGTLDRLQKPENSSQLTNIAKYHIVAGSLLASQLTNGQKVKTTNDQEVVASLEAPNVYVIDAKGGKALVTTSDIKAQNGVIHIIDAVLLPQ